MAKIYARTIHDGTNEKYTSWRDVPARWQQATKDAYMELYGQECP